MKNISEKLCYYVIKYEHNRKKVVRYNIFDKIDVMSYTQGALLQYEKDKNFDKFLEELVAIVQWKLWGRYEYEVSVSAPFPREEDEIKKIDAFHQFGLNAEVFARYLISEIEKERETI